MQRPLFLYHVTGTLKDTLVLENSFISVAEAVDFAVLLCAEGFS